MLFSEMVIFGVKRSKTHVQLGARFLLWGEPIPLMS